MTTLDRRKKFIINTLYWAIVLGLVFLVTRYLLRLIWPFFLAFIFAWCLKPAVRWLTVKCHLRHGISVAICLLIFFGAVGGLLTALIFNVVSWAQALVTWLPTFYSGTIEPLLRDATEKIEEFVTRLDPESVDLVTDTFSNIISSAGSAVSSFSMRAVGAVTDWVTKVPGKLFSTIICVIATVFMTADFHRITAFLLRQLSPRTRHLVIKAKETFFSVLRKYGSSYGIIMSVTFVELSVGLLILRQDKALLLALIIAMLDILPVIGAGLFLIPWSLASLLAGATAKGLGLLALYIVITVIRQFLEPRVVGHQVGLHPLITLIAMVVGTKLFGGIGLLGLPIACAIMKSLDDTGVIHILRKEDDDLVPADSAPPEKN